MSRRNSYNLTSANRKEQPLTREDHRSKSLEGLATAILNRNILFKNVKKHKKRHKKRKYKVLNRIVTDIEYQENLQMLKHMQSIRQELKAATA